MKEVIGDMFAVKSQDGGLSFPEYENIDYLNWFINQCPSTGPDAFIDNNTLFTVSASQASGRYRCYLAKTDMINTQPPETAFMLPAPEFGGNAIFKNSWGILIPCLWYGKPQRQVITRYIALTAVETTSRALNKRKVR